MIDLQHSRKIIKRVLPQPVYHIIRNWHQQRAHKILLGSLYRLTPISRVFGSDRGVAICHYYIREFLSGHVSDIHGRVLEIGDDIYTHKFGGDRVIQSDVLHVTEGNPKATIQADLTSADHIPSNMFDCIICTQTLQCIYNIGAVIQTIYRILKPGGVLLATFSGISQISRYDMDRWGDYWRFTTASVEKLFAEFWPSECTSIKAYGNVLVAIAYLYGLASNDLHPDELEFHDPDYQVLIAGRAVKPVDIKGVVS
jgi:SAM-dependent methyltransferase